MSRVPGDQPASVDARLERAWREVSREEPPPALDDAIRAAARKAVRAGPRPAGAAPFGGRWRVPLSVAAVLVVSATVTLLVAEREKPGSPALQDGAPPLGAAPAPSASMPEASPQPELQAQSAERDARPAPSAPSPERQSDALGSTARDEVAGAREVRGLAEAPRTQQRIEPAPAPAAEDEAKAGVPAAAAPAYSLRDVAPAAAEKPAAKREAGGGVEPEEPIAQEAPVAATQAQEAVPGPAARRGAPSAFPAGARVAASPGEDAVADIDKLEPKAWLERILELRRQGRFEEAARSLEAFRERYPDHPLPPELSESR